MYHDSLKDQAEKLMIPGFAEDSSAVGRLAEPKSVYMPGGLKDKRRQQEIKKAAAIEKKLDTDKEQKKEVARLRKELVTKEQIEEKIKVLESEKD